MSHCAIAFPITSMRSAVRHAHARVCMSVRECARVPRRAAAGLFPVIPRVRLSFCSFVNFSFIFVNFLFFSNLANFKPQKYKFS